MSLQVPSTSNSLNNFLDRYLPSHLLKYEIVSKLKEGSVSDLSEESSQRSMGLNIIHRQGLALSRRDAQDGY